MNFAIHSTSYPGASYQQLASYAQETGSALILHLDPCGSAMGLSRDQLFEAAAYFRKNAIRVSHLITTINLVGFDAHKVNMAKKALNLAAILGADAITFTAGPALSRHSEYKNYDHQGIILAVRQMCAYAKSIGVEVWLTPANDYTRAFGLFNTVAMDNLGLAWNVLRNVEYSVPFKSFFHLFHRRVRHIYMEDGIAPEDKDVIAYTPCKIGAGEVAFAELMQLFLELGYKGSFSSATNDFADFKNYINTLPMAHVVEDPAKQLAYPMPDFTPPAGHPRVYIRPQLLDRLRANMSAAQNQAAYTKFTTYVNTPLDLNWGADGKLDYPMEMMWTVEAKAYQYALFSSQTHGLEAIAFLRNLLRNANPAKWDYNRNGHAIYTLAIVYDWCYALMTDEDKAAFYDAVIRFGQRLEVGYPPVKQDPFSGHGPEAQLMRDLMCAGIAMFDEYPNIYQNTAGRFFKEFVAERKFLYSMHCFHEGVHYFSYRMQWDMFCTFLFDRIGYPRIFGDEQLDTLRHYLYAFRPDGAVMESGDTNNREKLSGKYSTRYTRTFLLGASYWKDPDLKAAALHMLQQEQLPDLFGNQSITPTEFLLFNDPELEGRARNNLPLLHYQPAPKGGLMIHTDWTDGIDSSDAVCELKINHYWHSGHQHLDAGAFQIYYKGLLASDDGYYQSWNEPRLADRENNGYTGWGSLHHYNYTRRTIAHNCMLVYDPNEHFRDDSRKVHFNDGGQKLANRGLLPATAAELMDPANGYRSGTTLAHAWGPNAIVPRYAYLKGDLTPAYSEKMESYQRSFLYLRMDDSHAPMALLVFDRVVSSNPEFKKTWLCHGLSDPLIKGNRSVFKNTAEIPGSSAYCGRYNGKLTIDTLLPHNPAIHSIGGPGRYHMVNGVHYFAKVGPGQRQEGHGWRLEVSPSTPSKEDHFLHVLQVGDADGAEALPVQTMETEHIAGAVFAQRVAVFSKHNGFDKQVDFSFTGDGNFEIYVADLQPGQWEICCNGQTVNNICVDEKECIAIFTGTAGNYTIVRKEN